MAPLPPYGVNFAPDNVAAVAAAVAAAAAVAVAAAAVATAPQIANCSLPKNKKGSSRLVRGALDGGPALGEGAAHDALDLRPDLEQHREREIDRGLVRDFLDGLLLLICVGRRHDGLQDECLELRGLPAQDLLLGLGDLRLAEVPQAEAVIDKRLIPNLDLFELDNRLPHGVLLAGSL